MQGFSDKELVQNYLTGDEKLLEVLFREYLKPLYNFVYWYVGDRQEAEDIAQETFFRAWRNLKKFDQRKNFKTWIFAIAKNAAIDFLKKKKAVPFRDFENEEGDNVLAETMEDPTPLPDELLERADAADVLKSALEKLSAKYRTVLLLYYSSQLTFAEIAEVLGEPLNTVKSRYRRGLIILRNNLDKIA